MVVGVGGSVYTRIGLTTELDEGASWTMRLGL